MVSTFLSLIGILFFANLLSFEIILLDEVEEIIIPDFSISLIELSNSEINQNNSSINIKINRTEDLYI